MRGFAYDLLRHQVMRENTSLSFRVGGAEVVAHLDEVAADLEASAL